MKYYYRQTKKGKLSRIAKIYTKDEHHISSSKISVQIKKVVRELQARNHSAFIVGGAVRDLLCGKNPKDFDVVTDAHPNQIKKYFRRAKIVGRRFPIVLVPIGQNECVDITTYRANKEDTLPQRKKVLSPGHAVEKTSFGSIEEDVYRRDFTCNSLYYNIEKEEIIDFVNGFEHIKQKKLIPVRTAFDEDPIRMLRAIKYSCKVGLTIPKILQVQIALNAKKLATVPSSRISDETIKMLTSGASKEIFAHAFSYKLIKYLLPNMHQWFKHKPAQKNILFDCLARADEQIEKPHNRIRGFQMFFTPYILALVKEGKIPLYHKHVTSRGIDEIQQLIRIWIQPITPPNLEIQKAIIAVLAANDLSSPHSKAKRSRRRSTSSKA